jgi:hypothetical protein
MPSAAQSSEREYRPSYGAAAIAAGAVLLLYLITLGPSSAMWDTSEYIATAYILGLPHPPGNPFFVLIGRVFTILPIGDGPAMRVNLLAALCSAMSAGLWFLVTEHVLSRWFVERWQRIAGATLSVVIGATAFTVWSQSVVNEKVYTVSLLGVALVSWLAIRWTDNPDGRKGDRLLVLIAYLLGLGYANHMAGFIPAPAVALAVMMKRPRTILRWRLLLACAGAAIIGMTPFATQPIRAAYFPSINEGEPTGCRTEFGWSCTFTKETWEAFKYNFNREQFGKLPLMERQAPFGAQVGMWWLYFKWQWLRDAYDQTPPAQAILAAAFLVLGLFGGWVHWKRDRQSFWYFGPLMASLTLVLIFYLNFKYGYSQSPELQSVDREVRDRDYFYLWSFSAWGVWAALGLVFVWESIAALVGMETRGGGKDVIELPRRRSWAAASPVLLLAFVPLIGNWSASTRRGDTTTRDFAHDLLNSVEPYGILVTAGDNDTFPLWYAQEVEGIRRDVLIANTSLLNTDWYARQMIRAPIREYDASKGPELYRGKSWPRPSGPALKMTLDEVDSIPYVQQLSDTALFTGPGDIRARVSPRILTKADIAVLAMIRDNPDRPIYFARTIGNYGEQLGLGPWLVTQGLAKRLVQQTPTPSRDTLLVAGEGWVDVIRSRDLWLKDSLGPKAIIRKGGWPDKASLNIPVTYLVTGLMLSEVLRSVGQDSAAAAILAETKQVAVATRLAGAINFDAPAVLPAVPDSDVVPKTPVPSKRDTPRTK